MREILMDALMATVMAVAAGAACVICAQMQKAVAAWLEKAKQEAESRDMEVAARLFSTANKVLQDLTYNAVAAMEQTKAKDLREKVKAGLEDRSMLTILAKDVLYNIKAQLKPDLVETLGLYIGDLDAYITDQIEACLLGIKRSDLVATLGEPLTADTCSGYGAIAEDNAEGTCPEMDVGE